MEDFKDSIDYSTLDNTDIEFTYQLTEEPVRPISLNEALANMTPIEAVGASACVVITFAYVSMVTWLNLKKSNGNS